MNINKDSGQVEIVGPYGRVYLYTHSGAGSLVNDIHSVLSMRQRWDDPDYLAKMVFCKMVPVECWNTDLGFGIGTQLYADVNLLITLDTVNQKILLQSATDKHYKLQNSFKDFVINFLSRANI
jgi:hypothetical protein